jgi:hypothetical protein
MRPRPVVHPFAHPSRLVEWPSATLIMSFLLLLLWLSRLFLSDSAIASSAHWEGVRKATALHCLAGRRLAPDMARFRRNTKLERRNGREGVYYLEELDRKGGVRGGDAHADDGCVLDTRLSRCNNMHTYRQHSYWSIWERKNNPPCSGVSISKKKKEWYQVVQLVLYWTWPL